MEIANTTQLLSIQPFCYSQSSKSFVSADFMTKPPEEAEKLGPWIKREREKRGWSASELARRVNGIASERADPTRLSQQNLSKYEQGGAKRIPPWTRHAIEALDAGVSETAFDAYLSTGKTDSGISIRALATHVGLGGGGTGEGDEGSVTFSRDLIQNDLRLNPDDLMVVTAKGNSMEPDYFGGDQMLIHLKDKAVSQGGAFCLWDGDGIVIKYLDRIMGSDPVQVRVISKNNIYNPTEHLVEELNIVGRVVWFGRRVQ